MQTIKKYANRKLYHINRKRYITLDGVAQLVQSGEQVQVIDNETGEDITANILAQVVLQTRGRNGGPLPTNVLTGLIRLSGGKLAGWRRTLIASVVGQDIIDAEIERRLERLVSEGTLTAEDVVRLRPLLLRRDVPSPAEDEAEPAESEVPSRNDVVRLHEQIDALTAVVEQLVQQRGRKLPDEDA